MSENGEIYTAVKNFTLPPAVTALTNSSSASNGHLLVNSHQAVPKECLTSDHEAYMKF